jgi:succinoglycan biosynthesis protein ExoL
LITSRYDTTTDTEDMGEAALEQTGAGIAADCAASRSATIGTLFFFCPDFTDAPTLTRMQQFADHGYDAMAIGFRRTRYNNDYVPPWPHIALGRTADGKYGQRLRALLGALRRLFANRRLFAPASIFYARNLDQLLLALLTCLFAWKRVPIAYEVLDIPPIMTRRSVAGAILRWIERRCLRYVEALILSSPGFHRGYYDAIQRYRGNWFLLENKLHPSNAGAGRPPGHKWSSRRQQAWIVGYFGLIRGQETFDLMTRLAERLRGRVEFRFRGILTTVDAGKFRSVLARQPNMTYGGPYRPYQDLAAMYHDVDFAWALDLEHTDHNSRWLLPCRFYEAGYFGVPCLAVHGFEVGSIVENHRIGFTFEPPLEDEIVRFFERLGPADYDRVCAQLRAMPTRMFVADEDGERLCALLDRVAARRIVDRRTAAAGAAS